MGFVQDLRFGLRSLVRQPTFTGAALAALALGIGANTAMFSVVHAVLLRPLPFPEAERLVYISGQDPARGIPFHQFLYRDFVEWQRQVRLFESTAAYTGDAVSIAASGRPDEPEPVRAWRVTFGMLRTLGVQPVLGRDFLPEEDRPGAPRVALLSHELWKRRFGADPRLVGAPIMVNGENCTVAGILPPAMQIESPPVELYLPLARSAAGPGPDVGATITGLGLLKPGVTIQQAQAETTTIVPRLTPAFFSDGKRSLRVWGMREFLVRDLRLSVLVLLGAVALVLLIACANVANLLLARAGAREREIAVRASLGAGRFRIVRQLLTENALLGAGGAAAGLALAWLGIQVLVLFSPARYVLLRGSRIDVPVLAFTLALALLTALVFGLAPALAAVRGTLHDSLKEGGRSLAGGAGRARSLLVAGEVALALVLAAGAGLLLKAFLNLRAVRPGFTTQGLLTAAVNLPPQRYGDPAGRIGFYNRVLEKLRATPGVKWAGMVNQLPMGGINSGMNVHIEGKPEPRPEDAGVVWYRFANGDYFRAMEIPLLRGRLIDRRDRRDAPAAAVINDTMARRYWPGEDPVGKRLGFGLSHRPGRGGQAPSWITVVGVVGDVRHMSLSEPPQPEIFLAYEQMPPNTMTLAVRTGSDPARLAPALRRAVSETDAALALSRVASMEQLVSDNIAGRRFSMLLLGIFAGLAVALAAVGVYGLMSFTVTRRTREIGIRMAMGARAGDVLGMVMRYGMTRAGLGLAAGLAASLALTRLLRTLLFGVTATDPAVFAAVIALLAAVAALACWLPARRAARTDPMQALRYE